MPPVRIEDVRTQMGHVPGHKSEAGYKVFTL